MASFDLSDSTAPLIESSPELLSLCDKKQIFEDFIEKENESYLNQYEIHKLSRRLLQNVFINDGESDLNMFVPSNSSDSGESKQSVVQDCVIQSKSSDVTDVVTAENNCDENLKMCSNPTDVEEVIDDKLEFRRTVLNKISLFREKLGSQNNILEEVNKALQSCLGKSTLIYSDYRLEAERLLLECVQKRLAYSSHINFLQTMVNNPEIFSSKLTVTKGKLFLTNMKVPLRKELIEISKRYLNYYFALTITNGTCVFVSELSTVNSAKYLEFDFCYQAIDLDKEFSIILKLFCFEITKKIKRTRSLWRNSFSKRNQNLKWYISTSNQIESNFNQLGQFELNISTLHQDFDHFVGSFQHPLLEKTFSIKSFLCVNHCFSAEGYFHLKSYKTIFWDRFWFQLRGHLLSYWHNRDDCNLLSPVGIINLKRCINPSIDMYDVDLHLYMRINTLILVTEVENKPTTLLIQPESRPQTSMYFISHTNKEQLACLCKQIQDCLKSILDWKDNEVSPYDKDSFDRIILRTH